MSIRRTHSTSRVLKAMSLIVAQWLENFIYKGRIRLAITIITGLVVSLTRYRFDTSWRHANSGPKAWFYQLCCAFAANDIADQRWRMVRHWVKYLSVTVVLGLSLTLSGCQRSAPRMVDVATVAQTEVKASTHKDGSARHVCGAKTRDGKTCQHPVKHDGDLCWVHKPIVPCSTNEDCSEKNGHNGDPVSK